MTGADLPGDPAESAGSTPAPAPAPTAADAAPADAAPPAPTPGPRVVPGPVTPAPAPSRAESPVSRAVALLDGLAERPLAEHPDAYQRVHEALQGALADIDDA